MAKISPFEIEGFDELNTKLKKLSDSVKRTEVLAIQKKQAAPVRAAFKANLPVGATGVLGKSVRVKAVPKSASGGNPLINIAPRITGKNAGWYRYMVVKKGQKLSGRGPGSRKGVAKVVENARNRTLQQMGAGLLKRNTEAVAKLVQKKIDKLSVI